jgi:uncharacterized protein YndB with AHSA1/START domain
MTDENYDYENSVLVLAAPQTVFEALTAASRLPRWFVSRAETDPRAGGAFTLAWEFADASQNGQQQGRFAEVIPGQKVSYPWQASPAPAPLTLVTFTLAPEGAGTRVRLTHTGFGVGEAGRTAMGHHSGPWDFYLANLKSYLETGVDNRAAMLKQTTY